MLHVLICMCHWQHCAVLICHFASYWFWLCTWRPRRFRCGLPTRRRRHGRRQSLDCALRSWPHAANLTTRSTRTATHVRHSCPGSKVIMSPQKIQNMTEGLPWSLKRNDRRVLYVCVHVHVQTMGWCRTLRRSTRCTCIACIREIGHTYSVGLKRPVTCCSHHARKTVAPTPPAGCSNGPTRA